MSEIMTQAMVEEHRKAVMSTGNISSFQLKNMKNWPSIVLGDYLNSVEIEYDFLKTELGDDGQEYDVPYEGLVCYDFSLKREIDLMEQEELDKRLEALVQWTKFLFWEDTEVKFKKEGKKWQM